MKKLNEEAKKQLDLMTSIEFELDENGDIDTDRANDVIFGLSLQTNAGDIFQWVGGIGTTNKNRHAKVCFVKPRAIPGVR